MQSPEEAEAGQGFKDSYTGLATVARLARGWTGTQFRKPFSLRDEESVMQPVEGYIDYQRREYCKDVKCPIQLLLNNEVEKSAKFEEIRAICSSRCIHSTHEFHRWLTEKGYLIVRPKQK